MHEAVGIYHCADATRQNNGGTYATMHLQLVLWGLGSAISLTRFTDILTRASAVVGASPSGAEPAHHWQRNGALVLIAARAGSTELLRRQNMLHHSVLEISPATNVSAVQCKRALLGCFSQAT